MDRRVELYDRVLLCHEAAPLQFVDEHCGTASQYKVHADSLVLDLELSQQIQSHDVDVRDRRTVDDDGSDRGVSVDGRFLIFIHIDHGHRVLHRRHDDVTVLVAVDDDGVRL